MAHTDPVQVVQAPCAVTLEIRDLTGVPEAGRAAKVNQAVMAEAQRPFNLSSDLMLRAKLLRLGADEHVLVLMSHHIASDGWSKGVMFRELAAFYNAAVSKATVAL